MFCFLFDVIFLLRLISLLSKFLIYVINNLNGEEIIGTFYEKERQKTNQKEFR